MREVVDKESNLPVNKFQLLSLFRLTTINIVSFFAVKFIEIDEDKTGKIGESNIRP